MKHLLRIVQEYSAVSRVQTAPKTEQREKVTGATEKGINELELCGMM